MKFMNKKEQVLDIQLTPYGEYLLSKGEFNPEYYAFYDDNILYESQYAGYSDSQNNVEGRTQEDTPQLESQITFSTRDLFNNVATNRRLTPGLFIRGGYVRTARDMVVAGGAEIFSLTAPGNPYSFPISQEKAALEEELKKRQELASINSSFFDRYGYGLQYCLGKSDFLKTDAPAWSISLLRGEISGSASAITGSNTPTINIPQLDITLTYKINIVSDIHFISDSELAVSYPNGSYLDVRPEIAIAQILERNSEFTKENFDIEVFEVSEATFKKNKFAVKAIEDGHRSVIETLRPLKFRRIPSLIQNNVLLEEDEIFISSEPLTQENVEYYFDIKVDSEISEQLICSSVSELKSKGFYVDTGIVCEDVENISLVDIYSTDASSEPCPDVGEDPCEPGTVY